MINLRDVTLTIPVRCDSEDRSENLRFVLEYLRRHLDTNIIVCEEDKIAKAEWAKEKAEYIFIQNDNELFHRTKRLNDMAKMANTKYIVNYDVDVILPPKSYEEAVNLLRNKSSQMVYPFTVFRMMGRRHLTTLRKNYNINDIDPAESAKFGRHDTSVGGIVFWDNESFQKIGMENQHFVSWGWEDLERYDRAKKLGLSINRVQGSLYHIEHKRSINSSTSNPMQSKNYDEYVKVRDMSKQQLLDYVKTWDWL